LDSSHTTILQVSSRTKTVYNRLANMHSIHQTTAAVLTATRGPITISALPVTQPAAGEVLLKLEACGLCHSDLFVSGLEKLPLLPLILGHEGIGRVEAVGDGVADWQIADRAGMTFLASTCRSCDLCRGGQERFCARQLNFGYTANGALTAYAVVPADYLVRVPEDLAAVVAAPLCCAGWTAFGALQQAALRPGSSVALFGMGGLGHLAIQYARHAGLRVAAVDVTDAKLEMACTLGAELAIPAENAGRTLQKQWGGADAAVVLTGSPGAIQQAFRSVKRTGTVITAGLSSNQYELPMVDTVLKGISIRGSYLGSRSDLDTVFHLARLGVGLPQVEEHRLRDVPQVFERMRRGEIMGRAVVAFD
jgi:propanol-preferring alcohol dehydrogenase